jgi:hypothetical protein
MAMLPIVHENVDERMADRFGRRESASVVSIGEDSPSARQGTIHRACDADREAANAARECEAVVRLCDQVHVIILNGELVDSEPSSR